MAETEDKDDVVIMMEDNFDPDKGKQEISKAQEDRSSVARESKKSKKPNDEDVEKTSIRSRDDHFYFPKFPPGLRMQIFSRLFLFQTPTPTTKVLESKLP